MPRRNSNGGLDLSPQEEKLLQLQQIQGMGQQEDAASQGETGNLVKMLSELYGIHEKQQIDPALLEKTHAETGLAQAHTDYYKERPEELKARAMAAELGGLDKAYAYDSNNPEYHQARRSVLQRYGYNLEAPTKPTPPEAYGTSGAKPPPTQPTAVGTGARTSFQASFAANPLTQPIYGEYELYKKLFPNKQPAVAPTTTP